MFSGISEREQRLLRILIERYIADGQPVSSKALAEEGLSYSPATIRNIMAELEEQGYLQSLHTSSGRVPTAQGYRLFVETLLTVKPLEETLVEEFQQKLHPDQSTKNLISTASNMLARLTRFASLVTLPKIELVRLKHIEFLPLSHRRILVILVLNEKEVQNRIIQVSRDFNRNELEQLSQFFNHHFMDKPLEQIRASLLNDLSHERAQFRELLHSVADFADHTLQSESFRNDFVMAGEYHLLASDANADLDRLRQLFDAINQKRQMLYLLDQCLAADGMKVFIGKESGSEALDQYSMISAPYHVNGRIVGALGVIGPLRMPYEQVMSVVETSARLLSAALANPEEL